ncbi:ABC transporter permease subunit [Hahella aquimaris]|uniref:ABC transporter permease subunit n=1 Tax=Hahella sp. HNIBRBA332 TaxID=3015983 RepID=UPI00273C51F8|nr:ABC transporter permease subunit [Hahella sp. HNIBRBA332]WLQ12145.1 ABC transporter permease subunit [Hahella sp. HNIBRBA332]
MLLMGKDKGVAAMAANMGKYKGRSLWADAARRFARNKAALVSLGVLGLLLAFSLFGHYASDWSNETIDWERLSNIYEQGKPNLENGHYFGLDHVGRDLYQRAVQGSRISLMIGVLGAFVAVVIGALYGAVSGFVGGKVDSLMMRLVDVLSAFPFMFLVIVLMAIFGRNVLLMFVAIGAVSWLNMARIVRGQTLSLKRKEFIEAAFTVGVHPMVIILRHVIPNLLGVVIVYAALLVPEMIMFESFISFLGLGVSEPQTSWGALISEGADNMRSTPWMLAFPMTLLIATLFCFNFIGDGLRDALDPKGN